MVSLYCIVLLFLLFLCRPAMCLLLLVFRLLFVFWCCMFLLYYFFFFKQKTAYEMRISDWSSDVCSSDLSDRRGPSGHWCPDMGDVGHKGADHAQAGADRFRAAVLDRRRVCPGTSALHLSAGASRGGDAQDRKSTRLNSSH